MTESSLSYDGNLVFPDSWGGLSMLTNNGFIPRLINLNNDIYVDLVVLPLGEYEGGYNKYSNTFYGSANGFEIGVRSLNTVEDCRKGNAKIQIGDFNADNIGDIMVFGAAYNFSSPYIKNLDGVTIFHDPDWSELVKDARLHLTYDFNNDGLTDMIFQENEDNNYQWKYARNTGGFDSFQVTDLTLFHKSSDATEIGIERDFASVIDFNGDGLVDVVIADETFVKDEDWHWLWNPNDYDFSYTTFYFYKNINGNSFELYGTSIVSNDRLPEASPVIADLNNDGVQDLVLINSSNIYTYSMIEGNKHSLVNNITNGMNQTIEYNYSNYSNYNQSSEIYPIRNVKAPLILATSLEDVDGNIINYEFEDAKAHVKGKGFLGFLKVTVSSQLKNTKTISNFHIDPDMYSTNLLNQVISTFSDSTVSTLSQVNDIIIVDSVRKIYIPIVRSQTSTDCLRGITSLSEHISFDEYGNVTQSKTTLGLTHTATTFTSYIPRLIGGVPYLPDTIKVSKQGGFGEFERSVICNYNSNGNLIKETKDPGDENELVTEYLDIDITTGQAKSIKMSANGEIRNSSLTYTDSKCFVKTKTNNLNETTTFNWNETTGLLTSETDHWGKVTLYNYNIWGQLEETIFPDNTRAANRLQWADVGNSMGAFYYMYSETSGNSPLLIWYDNQGKKICEESKGLNGYSIRVFTDYYPDGRIRKIYEPTFDNSTTEVNTEYVYDEYGRVKFVNSPMGEAIYTYNDKTVSIVTPEGTSEKTINDAGQTVKNKINDKAVDYSYYASGSVRKATPEDGQAITMYYDLQGNKIKQEDQNTGIIETKYDGFGKILWEKQKVHDENNFVITTYIYDDETGLLNSSSRSGNNNLTTTYTYDTESGHKSRLKSVEISGQHKKTFIYDNLGRIISINEDIENRSFNSSIEYDALGRVKKEVYPTGYYTINTYDNYGNKIIVKDMSGRTIWHALQENERKQLTEISRGGIITNYNFDNRGLQTSIIAQGIINYEYNFDSIGNLTLRRDNLINNQKEVFNYDALNRLTNWAVYLNGSTIATKLDSIHYNSLTGNIERKSDLGNVLLNYGENGKPHALTSISAVPTNFPADSLDVTYTDFKKIKTLTEGSKHYILTYGIDDQRRKSEYKINGVTQKTKYYLGDYEEETDNLGNTKKIHYLSGGAILIITNGVETLYYGYSDYQGNLIALANEAGTVVERYAYDPWGKRRNPENWAQDDTRTSWIIDRGYTMHEHLDAFGIINMNGRVYDPLTAMFFSPDPFLQAPDNWLNYNRYSYVLNNPFKYTDPSGNLFYLIPTVSYSYYGGVSVGVSAGFGLPGGASVGGSVSYNFKQQNWTFTGNASFSGLYAYAGFDTKAGIVAGAGFGFQSIVAGNFSFPTNLFGASINYAGKGGMSLSMFGFNMGNDGIVFDPSISISTTFKYGTETYESDGNAINYEEDSKHNFPYVDDASLNQMIVEFISFGEYNIDKISAFDNYTSVDGKPNPFSNYYRDAQGYLLKAENGTSKRIGGVTSTYWKGWKSRSSILLSQIRNTKVFINTINHELTHAYINANYRTKMNENTIEFKKFTESSAYVVGNSKIPTKFQNGIFRLVTPPKLLPNPDYFFYPKPN